MEGSSQNSNEVEPSRLEVLAREINEDVQAADDHYENMVRYAISAGEKLIEAKKLVNHGEWLPWLKANFSKSVDTAGIYMKLARNSEPIRNLKTVSDALAYLGPPKSEATIRDAVAWVDPTRPQLPQRTGQTPTAAVAAPAATQRAPKEPASNVRHVWTPVNQLTEEELRAEARLKRELIKNGQEVERNTFRLKSIENRAKEKGIELEIPSEVEVEPETASEPPPTDVVAAQPTLDDPDDVDDDDDDGEEVSIDVIMKRSHDLNFPSIVSEKAIAFQNVLRQVPDWMEEFGTERSTPTSETLGVLMADTLLEGPKERPRRAADRQEPPGAG
jgi:hypothetical protein